MFRRFLVIVALVSCAVLYVRAVERATFILTDGERKSGTVVFHGGQDENLINGHLNLGSDSGGKDLTIPIDQVAVIDFAGGGRSVPAAELDALPSDNSHLLVLRSGQSQTGRLVNLIRGETLIWQNAGGQQQQYAIRDVSRVYLNPQIARTVLDRRANPPSGTTVAGTAGQVLAPGAVRVEANQAWTNTGVMVKRGDRVVFRATGQINWGQGADQTAGPDGNASLTSRNYPVPVMPVGGLIGKVGNSAPFPIGSNSQPIVMPANGQLMLGVNDNDLGDNSGFFSVVVIKQ
jgi:hypothetical protein